MQAIFNSTPGERPNTRFFNAREDFAAAGFVDHDGDPIPEGMAFAVDNEAFSALVDQAEGDPSKLRINPAGNGLVVHVPDAAELASIAFQAKRTELKKLRDRYEFGVFSHDGHRYQCRLADAAKIKGILTDLGAGIDVLPVTWIDADNESVTFNKESDVTAWNAALSTHVRNVYLTYGGHMEGLATAPDASTYDITTGW